MLLLSCGGPGRAIDTDLVQERADGLFARAEDGLHEDGIRDQRSGEREGDARWRALRTLT